MKKTIIALSLLVFSISSYSTTYILRVPAHSVRPTSPVNVSDSISSSQATSSSHYNEHFSSFFAFDKSLDTRWETAARSITNQWIVLDFEQNIKVTSFDYYNSTEGNYTLNRGVKDFRLEGSDNNKNWTTYLESEIPNVLHTTHTFSIDNVPEKGHRYWRFYMINNHGNIYAIVANDINFYGFKK